ncbi:hypothetical protein ACEA49_26530, partial [Escherichia coli]
MQLIVDYPDHNIYSSFVDADAELRELNGGAVVVITVKIPLTREGANKQVISSQADSLIKISRIWADFFPA